MIVVAPFLVLVNTLAVPLMIDADVPAQDESQSRQVEGSDGGTSAELGKFSDVDAMDMSLSLLPTAS